MPPNEEQGTPVMESTPPVEEGQVAPEAAPAFDREAFSRHLRETPDARAVLEEYLESLSDEDASKLKPINRRVDRFVNQKSQELQQRFSQAEQTRVVARQWMAQFDQQDEAQQLEALKNPQIRANFDRFQRLLASPSQGPSYQEFEGRVYAGLKKLLKEFDPDFRDDIKSIEELREELKAAKERGVSKAVEELKAELLKQSEALEAKLRAELALGKEQPDKLKPTGGKATSTRLTRGDLAEMTPDEYAKRRTDIIASLKR